MGGVLGAVAEAETRAGPRGHQVWGVGSARSQDGSLRVQPGPRGPGAGFGIQMEVWSLNLGLGLLGEVRAWGGDQGGVRQRSGSTTGSDSEFEVQGQDLMPRPIQGPKRSPGWSRGGRARGRVRVLGLSLRRSQDGVGRPIWSSSAYLGLAGVQGRGPRPSPRLRRSRGLVPESDSVAKAEPGSRVRARVGFRNPSPCLG